MFAGYELILEKIKSGAEYSFFCVTLTVKNYRHSAKKRSSATTIGVNYKLLCLI